MVKRIFSLILAVLLLLALAGCVKTKTVHCDHCGEELAINANSNMTDDWIIYCKQCENDLFGDNPVVSPGN